MPVLSGMLLACRSLADVRACGWMGFDFGLGPGDGMGDLVSKTEGMTRFFGKPCQGISRQGGVPLTCERAEPSGETTDPGR